MRARDYLRPLRLGAKLLSSDIVPSYWGTQGNVYFAAKSTDAWYQRFLKDANVSYTDGTTSVKNTAQAAIDACTAKRGDVVLVADASYTSGDKWKENVVINKEAVKVLAINQGWETQFRPGDATTKYTLSGNVSFNGASLFVAARSVEVAGFLFDGGGGYAGAYVGDLTNTSASGTYGSNKNAASSWFHHNVFRGGNEGTYGLVVEGCSANVTIEYNIFEEWDNACIYVTPGGSRTVQRLIIRDNEFEASDGTDYGVDIYGAATTVGTLIKKNTFRDSANAFTMAVRVNSGATGVTSVVGNWFACANAMDLLATDYHCGNFKGNATATEEYVTESSTP